MDPDKLVQGQTVWIQIRLLLLEQSDLSLNCLIKRLLKHFSRQQRQTIFVVIGALRASIWINSVNERQCGF